MALSIVTALPIIASILVLFVAYKLFPRGSWFVSWLRGTGMVVTILVAITLLVSVSQIASFRAFQEDRKIAQIELKQKAPQQFVAHLLSEGVVGARSYELHGDMWQLDAKVVKWADYLEFFGFDAAYRFDRISGRYENLHDERSRPRSVYSLYQDSYVPDIWGLKTEHPWLPGIAARYGSGTYVPMVDGAKYAIFLRNDGMYAKPMNAVAKNSVSSWN